MLYLEAAPKQKPLWTSSFAVKKEQTDAALAEVFSYIFSFIFLFYFLFLEYFYFSVIFHFSNQFQIELLHSSVHSEVLETILENDRRIIEHGISLPRLPARWNVSNILKQVIIEFTFNFIQIYFFILKLL